MSGKKLQAVIAQGQSGQITYDVEFTGGKLVINFGDPALGAGSSNSVDAALVVQALFKALPQNLVDQTLEGLILSGIKLVP